MLPSTMYDTPLSLHQSREMPRTSMLAPPMHKEKPEPLRYRPPSSSNLRASGEVTARSAQCRLPSEFGALMPAAHHQGIFALNSSNVDQLKLSSFHDGTSSIMHSALEQLTDLLTATRFSRTAVRQQRRNLPGMS